MHAHRAQSVGQGRRADEIKGGVDAVRVQFAHGRGDLPGVEQGVVDAVLLQEGEAVGLPGAWTAPCAAPGAQRAAAARPTEE